MTDHERSLVHLPPRAVAAASDLAARTLAERDERSLAPTMRTLLVDASDPSCYGTIGEAVEAALPGDRVLVRPGHYRRVGAHRQAPSASRAMASATSIVVEGPDQPAFVLAADGASVRGLTATGGRAWPDDEDEQGAEDSERVIQPPPSCACPPRLWCQAWWYATVERWAFWCPSPPAPTIKDSDIHGNAAAQSGWTSLPRPRSSATRSTGDNGGPSWMMRLRRTDDHGQRHRGKQVVRHLGEGLRHAHHPRQRHPRERVVRHLVSDSAKPTIRDNDIRENEGDGIWVSDSAKPCSRATTSTRTKGTASTYGTPPRPPLAAMASTRTSRDAASQVHGFHRTHGA